jgi:hypothetical protein
VTEWTIAYLMGPVVMLIIGIAMWGASHYHPHHDRRLQKPRAPARWLDTHYADWLHHRH